MTETPRKSRVRRAPVLTKERLQLHLTPALNALIGEDAAARGMTLSGVVEFRLSRDFKKNPPGQDSLK